MARSAGSGSGLLHSSASGRRLSVMITLAVLLALAPFGLAAYCWIIYPLILSQLRVRTEDCDPIPSDPKLPGLTVVIAAHNAACVLHDTLHAIVADDYPAERRTIIVVSDGSRDDTARIVRAFRRHDVHLLQSRRRRGKTSAENLAAARVDGEIVVCMDANVRIERGAIRALVREFQCPSVGVVSGTDVAIGAARSVGAGERAYIRVEMWLRSKESSRCGLVGASGCFYAVRRSLFTNGLRPSLTRDFATVLLARRSGLRAVVANDARCTMSTSTTARAEYARKARTIAQGLETLAHFRDLMNPFRYGRFALALISHKLCRWLIPLAIPPAAAGAAYLLASESLPAALWSLLVISGAAGALVALKLPFTAIASYAVLVQLATITAWLRFVRGKRIVTWNPTPRSPYVLRSPR